MSGSGYLAVGEKGVAVLRPLAERRMRELQRREPEYYTVEAMLDRLLEYLRANAELRVTWADNQTEGEMLEEVSDYMRQIQAWADLYDQEPPPMTAEEFKTLLDQVSGESLDIECAESLCSDPFMVRWLANKAARANEPADPEYEQHLEKERREFRELFGEGPVGDE